MALDTHNALGYIIHIFIADNISISMYIMCVSNKNNKNTGSNHILLMITIFFPFVNELPGVLVDLNCFHEENSSYFA